MSRAPGGGAARYVALLAFIGLLAVPMSWALAAIGTALLLRVSWAVARSGGMKAAAVRGAPAGVPLGVSSAGREVGLTDGQLSTHGLIVGASGAGKSTTLLRILSEQIERGLPVVALDLKGSPSFAAELEGAAQRAGRPFRVWTPEGGAHWNPLARGNPTELKDKLIGTERFTEPHYQRAAERYLQIALRVMAASGQTPDLEGVVSLLDPRRLAAQARQLDEGMTDPVQDYLASLTPDQLSAVRGLGTRLALLSESQAGPFLAPAAGAAPEIDLRDGLAGREVVLFSLNSARYGKLAAQIGTLAVQDLISVAGERLEDRDRGRAPATVAIDEFSALGSDHVLALLARGRESGVSVLLATQELADLERAGLGFRDQVLGLTAVKIAHRQDVASSAQLIAQMAGTEQIWERTHAVRGLLDSGSGNRGTRRLAERFIVHPNEIKTLETGRAIVLTKTPQSGVTRVRVSALPERAGSERHGPEQGRRGAGR